MSKIHFGECRPFKATRPGTRPNDSANDGRKLVTITDGNAKQRVSRKIAAEMVKDGKWHYCPKK